MATIPSLRRAVSRSRLAPLAAFPVRARNVMRYDAHVIGLSLRWLFTSREHHNYTYHLSVLSLDHLAWFLVAVCGIPIASARAFLREVATDRALRDQVGAALARSPRRGLADREVRLARRVAWYAIVRARRPEHVVESGVDKGLSTVLIAAALKRNAEEGHPGRVTAIDINPEAGYLVRTGPWADVVDLVYADSLAAIAALDRPVDVFLHDSDHSPGHEAREFAAIEEKLAPDALLLTDNAANTTVLSRHAERTGRCFLAFKESPVRHWYPGDAIGAAWVPVARS